MPKDLVDTEATKMWNELLEAVEYIRNNDAHDAALHAVSILRALPISPGKCVWTEQATCYWTTTCGHDFSDDDGISFKWCGYCGGKLVEQQAKWAPDDNGPDR